MTTTKEDQQLKLSDVIDDYIDDYEMRCDDGDYLPTDQEKMLITDAIYGLLEDDDFKKACAESYEKKLAESNDLWKDLRNVLECTQRNLSEANARNARLVESMTHIQKRAEEAMAQRVLVDVGTRVADISYIANKAISANSEAIAIAYDREVVDNFICKLRGIPSIGLSERQFGELHAANKGKEIV